MDAEIIIIIVAVVLSILSGINKNKKKTGSGNPGIPQGVPEEEDPWATIRKYIEEARTEGNTEEEELDDVSENRAEQRRIRSAQTVEPAMQHPEQDPYMDSLREYMHKKEIETAGREVPKKKSGTRIQAPREMPEVVPDTLADDLMDDFDLRKAIIYSEILKPKYEEI
ncbi:MAG: hypothetical protein LUD76_05015 [Alistipes sp.]|nr:hypothetical protein [Alistipes sp.]